MKIAEIKVENKALLTIINNIKRNCSDYINNDSKYLLFRGMSGTPDYSEVKIRQDRKSLSGAVEATKIFNLIFEKKFGIENIRSKVSFTTTSFSRAEIFGDVYIVFPKNGAVLFTQPGISDSGTKTLSQISEIISPRKIVWPHEEIPATLSQLVKYNTEVHDIISHVNGRKLVEYEKFSPKTLKLDAHSVEFMLYDDSYYVISWFPMLETFGTIENFLEELRK